MELTISAKQKPHSQSAYAAHAQENEIEMMFALRYSGVRQSTPKMSADSPFIERPVFMSGVSSVGSSVSVQQITSQNAAQSGASSSKAAEEQAESPSQEAAENEGGGLNVQA